RDDVLIALPLLAFHTPTCPSKKAPATRVWAYVIVEGSPSPVGILTFQPAFADHTLVVPSAAAVVTSVPSGLKPRPLTALCPPRKATRRRRSLNDQTPALPLASPTASSSPSGLKA